MHAYIRTCTYAHACTQMHTCAYSGGLYTLYTLIDLHYIISRHAGRPVCLLPLLNEKWLCMFKIIGHILHCLAGKTQHGLILTH